ncbi:MAG: rhomboid family intramembrane serine protease [Gemmatales bacterium]|nr:rhomboid family intramembrane serine protease [Gemmatales bacterium]MDW8385772.1 rhomboid family intramembrane serine protease [Gemmatales bacterium]
MGIYDREYYRGSGSSLLRAWADSGRMCKILVAINAAVFVIQLATLPANDDGSLGPVSEWLAMKPKEVFYQGQVWRLVTACFLHSPLSIWHILFNMLLLWFFGPLIEDLYGSREFLAFYLTAGIIGNVAWGLTALWSHHGLGAHTLALGASGAIMGVLVVCALIYPHKTILLWWVLPIPLWAFTLLYVVGDLFVFLRGVKTGVAVSAHLGGAAFGLAYQKLGWRLTGGLSRFWKLISRRSRPTMRIHREEEPARVAVSREPVIDEQLEAKADAVLDKINRFGKDSLTEEDREILRRASEQYRKRKSF